MAGSSPAMTLVEIETGWTASIMGAPLIAIIGGSGLYDIPGLTDTRWERVETSFGAPSDALLFGRLGGQQLVFLPRHGRGHRIPPSQLNFRANIAALKQIGVTDIVSLSAVGSLKHELPPGTFVIIDQFIDRTFARTKSFFGSGLVAHVSMADPVCRRLGDALESVCSELDLAHRRGGTYLVMEGPQFSTRAESELHQSWGCSVIGMTNMPEAKLAREAEICYATVAMVTDYDCWHDGFEAVTVDAVLRILLANADKARNLVAGIVPKLKDHQGPCRHGCQNALDHALITAAEARDPDMLKRLDFLLARITAGQKAAVP
jgi:5'-methylthioadenosine phosphorylase